MTATRSKLRVCSMDDVDWNSALRVETADLVLAVYNVDGQFYVTDDQCTHGPGSLSEGELYNHEIECHFHGGRFDVRTGQVTAPPCIVPIRSYKAWIEANDVMIEI